jgi:hypothetical protein
VGYAVFGPSKVLVLGPDSSLGPMIAACVLPLVAANGDPARAVAHASALALMVGAITVLVGVFKLGFVADLLSQPTQIGYMNGLASGRTSWTAVLDAVRLTPDDDDTTVTATQVREVVGRLQAAGHVKDGDPDILLVFDSGYDVTRLAFLLADLPVQVLGRLRSDRVLQFPAPPPGRTGRPARHGPEFKFADPAVGRNRK